MSYQIVSFGLENGEGISWNKVRSQATEAGRYRDVNRCATCATCSMAAGVSGLAPERWIFSDKRDSLCLAAR